MKISEFFLMTRIISTYILRDGSTIKSTDTYIYLPVSGTNLD